MLPNVQWRKAQTHCMSESSCCIQLATSFHDINIWQTRTAHPRGTYVAERTVAQGANPLHERVFLLYTATYQLRSAGPDLAPEALVSTASNNVLAHSSPSLLRWN